MKHPQLKAEKRTVLGKQVKKLRRVGLLPANVYGHDLPSVSLQLQATDFATVFKEVGETGLIDLEVDGKKHPVLVKNLQVEFRNHTPLHVDFYQVNLKEKVKTMVPLVIVGEPQAVTEKLGTLIQPLNEVEVEALPEALPENVEVNVEHLAAVDEQILVRDLPVAEGVTVLTDPEQLVAKIAEIVEEPEPESPTEEETAETAAEGEPPAGEAPASEGQEEKPQE
jgi:large subunit ribosomal protein L25